MDVPEDGSYETVAGFMVSELGRIPQEGDVVDLEDGELRVTAMDGAAVEEIEYVPNDPETDPALLTLEERIQKLRDEEGTDG